MRKRGEISGEKIVVIILLIAGTVIVGGFLYILFSDDSLTDRELCHLSVVTRATTPKIAQDEVPLQCTTEKVCITSKFGGDCKQFAGEENIRRVRISLSDKEKARETIERESANAMFDCWSMMGEGKLDIFGNDFTPIDLTDLVGLSEVNFQKAKPKCVICSRVAIAEDILNSKEGKEMLTGVDVNEYMAGNNVPGSSLTYLQTFTDRGVGSYAGVDKGGVGNTYKPEANQMAYIFWQLKTEGSPADAFSDTALAGAGLVGGAGLLPGSGKLVKATLTKGGIWGVVVTAVGILGPASYAAYIAGENQDVSAAYCGVFESDEDEGKLGCSIVKGVEWNAGKINSFCSGGIEGNI
jgi:hypothetical protein